MAADVFDDPQGLPGLMVDEAVFRPFGDFSAVFVNQVARMGDIFGFLEFPLAGLPEVLPDLGLEFGELAPGLQRLSIVAEGRDAGSDEILVATMVIAVSWGMTSQW